MSGIIIGVCAQAVEVEAICTGGAPGFEIVGIQERAGREARTRVRAAVGAAGLAWPHRNLVVNLAPADLAKSGASFDLSLALAALSAGGRLDPSSLDGTLVLGELGLDGRLRGIRGTLAFLESLEELGLRRAIVPADNASEAAEAGRDGVLCAASLQEVVAHLRDGAPLSIPRAVACAVPEALCDVDLAEVRGQPAACRALEIAAAGAHPLLLVGPPGAGKTLLARRLPGLLPPPDARERRELARIASVAGVADGRGAQRRFRAPHQSASLAAVVGGGDPLRPGELTLAHRGVLFLDELPEFRRDVIEALRTTMESGCLHLSRARQRVTLPAQAQVIAAMNPCPCGYEGSAERACECAPGVAARYRQRVSGPILDRFALQVRVERVRFAALEAAPTGESSATVAARVAEARRFAAEREPFVARLGEHEAVDKAAQRFLEKAVDRLGLSARSYVRALRVARSIADLAAREDVSLEDVAEAFAYRLVTERPSLADPAPPRLAT